MNNRTWGAILNNDLTEFPRYELRNILANELGRIGGTVPKAITIYGKLVSDRSMNVLHCAL